MRSPRRAVATLCTAAVLMLPVACTAGAEPGDEREVESLAPSETPRTAGRSEDPQLMPIAVITHPSSQTVEISQRDAERIVAGEVRRWTTPDGRLRVVTGGQAAARVRAVARDVGAIAAVPADAVGPQVRVAIVDGINPLTSPGRYPLLTTGDAPPRPVTVTAVGDIMLARGVADAMGDDVFAPWRPTAERLRSADLTVGNLESSLSQNGTPIQGTDSFGADPAVLAGLERAGVDVLSLANNHVGDYGMLALQQTLRRIDRSAIERVGAGDDLAEASTPTVVEVNGTSFGFVAFNSIGEAPAAGADTPGVMQLRMPPRTGPLNRDDLNAITSKIRTLQQRVDVVIVLPHWGEQYTSQPIGVQRRVARQLANAGATVIVGGHPHWVQSMELVDDTVVAYSLGNYIFDMDFSVPTMEGILLDMTFWDGTLMAATPVPIVIDEQFAANIATGERGAGILDDIWSNSYGTLGRPS